MTFLVTTLRDIDTVVGTIAPGTPFIAVPDTTRDTWTLELSLPRDGVGSRKWAVPADAVQHGSDLPDAIQRRFAAWQDYRFARSVLGYDRDTAVQWLCRGYKVSLRTLERWGFTQHQLETA